MIGSSYLFQNDLDNAFLNLHKSLAIDRKYSSAFYNLARAYTLAGDKTKMLDCLEKAIAWSAKYQDYANLSLKDEHFKIYWDDSDFRSFLDRLPTEPSLRKLYKYLQDRLHYEAFTFGEELQASITDEVAVIEAMLSAVKSILKDLSEHQENTYLYDDKPISFWKEKLSELENDCKDRIESGKQSYVFSRFSMKPNRSPEKLFIVSNELVEKILKENNK